MNDDVLRTLLTAFIAGDRVGAVNAATQALDSYVHDFIFPDEAAPGEMTFDEPMDDVPMDAPLDDVPMDDVPMDAPLDDVPVDAPADNLDDMMAFESVSAPPEDDLQVPGVEDDSTALAAMSDEMGMTGDDVTNVEELPGDAPLDAEAGPQPNVVDVMVDPEQGDQVVSAVKVIYDNDTDFTFFTFARDAEQVVALVRQLCCGDEGQADMSLDDLTGQLKESFILL